MKIVVACLMSLIVSTALAADATDSPDRPAGVATQNWIRMGDSLGFVITSSSEQPLGGSRQILLAPPDSVSAELMPPAKGYFVVKTQTGWRRIVISNPTELAG